MVIDKLKGFGTEENIQFSKLIIRSLNYKRFS